MHAFGTQTKFIAREREIELKFGCAIFSMQIHIENQPEIRLRSVSEQHMSGGRHFSSGWVWSASPPEIHATHGICITLHSIPAILAMYIPRPWAHLNGISENSGQRKFIFEQK